MHTPLKATVERVLDDMVDVKIGETIVSLPKTCIAGTPTQGSRISLLGVTADAELPESLARAMLNELIGHEAS